MIETKALRKTFRSKRGTVEAVRGVDLAVAEGQVFGFLGPNGAGKTTTLRMLSTLLTPDGGEATVVGVDLRRNPGEVRRRIGYVGQNGGTWREATAREELVLQARLYGSSKAEAVRRAADSIEAFQLGAFADRKTTTYSGGQKRRLDIALGLVHGPRLVFLDEPTTGLDPQSRSHVWDEVRRLRSEGMTVFLTTHYLDEADALCDNIAIMDDGAIVVEGTSDELKRQVAGDVVTLGFGADGAETVPTARKLLDDASYLRKAEESGTDLRLYVEGGATAMPQILRELDGAGIVVESIELHRPSLDDVFLHQTGRSLRDEAA
ncbi:ATP-binding cassette domain-containing protein [Actinocatenispora rupis]|uniref:ATP-binding cassette domain-containing protein n=1 Tax=Actinocatenispora rupis TaxID=519421 RepID=UPI001940D27A|nr:ATP-binding cassette domain-containing protein [Actinocatenispora rupis]